MGTEKQNKSNAINLFQANVLFLQPIKSAEALWFFYMSLECRKETLD